jgi:hypothetical protein
MCIFFVIFQEHFSWSGELNIKIIIKTLYKYSYIIDGKKENMNNFQCNMMLKYNITSI